MLARTISKLTFKLVFFTATSLALVAGSVVTFWHRPANAPKTQPPAIKVQTTSPAMKFTDARVLATATTEQSGVQPLALAAADFDEDGRTDLLTGAINAGVGFLSFYRGQAEEAVPFQPANRFVNLPAAPDFLVTGDFNNDGHQDVVAAARQGMALYLLAGDGNGDFAEAVALELAGTVTALAAGEVNRVDGLADLAVAVMAQAGPQVLLYAGADGAWRAEPKSFALAQAATALEFAQLTRDSLADLAIAAGQELVTLVGDPIVPRLTRTALPFAAESLAVGRFTDKAQTQIALRSSDGSLVVASPEQSITSRVRLSNRAAGQAIWRIAPYGADSAAQVEGNTSSLLLRAHVTANSHDDLLTLRGAGVQLVINNQTPQLATATLEGGTELVAALPLRTTASALQSLIVLRRGEVVPLVVQPVPEAVFAVNSTTDDTDVNPGDGICNSSRTGAPACSLRAAIQEANATTALDTINFNIGTGTQTINLLATLPAITNPITLDALTGAPAGQVVVINSPTQATIQVVLELVSSGNTIRNLNFTNLNSGFISLYLNNSNDNFIEGNTIQGGNRGIYIAAGSRNTIGGTTAVQRNVIGGCFNSAILILGETSTANRVLGNYIGTNAAGTAANANGAGIGIDLATNTTIGGTTAGARNVISGNLSSAIGINGNLSASFLTSGGGARAEVSPEAADGTIIQGNYIGVNAAGTGALGNGSGFSTFTLPGINIDGASNTMIGGTATGAGNIIANSGSNGITIQPLGQFFGSQLPLNNAIQGNAIYTNGGLGIDLDTAGVTANDPGDGDTGANTRQNFPVLTSALTRTTGTTITGTLNSTANSSFTLEFFSNAACDASGNGEGETFVARATVTTNAAGVANFSVVSATQVAAGRFITATATTANNNTSEFSACRLVQNAVADLIVTQSVSPNPSTVNNNLTYNVTVTNSGPDDATGVALTNTIAVPGGQFSFVSATPSQGTCTGTGPINCNLGTIASTANATVRIVITPTIPLTPPGSGAPALLSVTATNTAAVASNEQDSNTGNNTVSTSATVNAVTDLAVTQTISPTTPVSGGQVTYTINVTNNGPSTAAILSGRIDPPVQLLNTTCTAPAGWSCNQDGTPFFISTTNLVPGTATITIRGTLTCFPQNTAISSSASISSLTTDPVTTNNTSTLNSTAQAGTAVGSITYDVANTTALQLGPVVAGNVPTPPSGTFVLTNTGCLPMNLTTAQFVRTGNTANFTGVDDSRFFSLRLVPTTGAEIPLNPTATPDRNAPQLIPLSRTLLSGQSLRFRVVFNPPLPFFAGFFASRDQLLFANQVLPDPIDSRVVFNFITGSNAGPGLVGEAAGDPGSAAANIAARVSPAIQIIPRDGNAVGGSTVPLVIMETLRGDFRIRVSLYDANKNATRITYQFFDTFRQPASNPIEINLATLLSSSPVLPGQAFTLQQDFSGAAARPDIVYCRVTVNDGDGTTVTATSSPFLPALTAPLSILPEAARSDVISLPTLKLDGRGGAPRQTDSRVITNER